MLQGEGVVNVSVPIIVNRCHRHATVTATADVLGIVRTRLSLYRWNGYTLIRIIHQIRRDFRVKVLELEACALLVVRQIRGTTLVTCVQADMVVLRPIERHVASSSRTREGAAKRGTMA